MAKQSYGKIINLLAHKEPEFYKWLERRGFNFDVSTENTPNDLMKAYERFSLQIQEIIALTDLASGLLLSPSMVAKHSRNSQNISLSDPPRIVGTSVIDAHEDQRPYDAFMPAHELRKRSDLSDEIYNFLYGLQAHASYELKNDLDYSFGDAFEGIDHQFTKIFTSRKEKLSALNGGENLKKMNKIFIDSLIELRNPKSDLEYIRDVIQFHNKAIDTYLALHSSGDNVTPSQLLPYSLAACRFCHEVIYPEVIKRTQELIAMVDEEIEKLPQERRQIDNKAKVKKVVHQGNLAFLPHRPRAEITEATHTGSLAPVIPLANYRKQPSGDNGPSGGR